MDLSSILARLKAGYGQMQDYAANSKQGLQDTTANLLMNTNAGYQPDEASAKAKAITDMAMRAGNTIGAIGVVAAPEEMALQAAREGMTAPGTEMAAKVLRSPQATGVMNAEANMAKVDPSIQKALVEELSTGTKLIRPQSNYGRIIYK